MRASPGRRQLEPVQSQATQIARPLGVHRVRLHPIPSS
jgi:hypothetical protein